MFIFSAYILQCHEECVTCRIIPSSDAETPDFVLSLLSCDNLARCMEILDMALHDVGSLNYLPSLQAASALCLVIPEAARYIIGVVRYQQEDIESCMDFLRHFVILPHRPLGTPVSSYMPSTVQNDEEHTSHFFFIHRCDTFFYFPGAS